MGCDIHGSLEIRETSGKEPFWMDIQSLPYTRHYKVFALLAGVRNYESVKPVSKPKGLPENIGFVTKSESDDLGVDGHSHSWLTAEELAARYSDFPMEWRAFITYLLELSKIYGKDGVRIVFWFDN